MRSVYPLLVLVWSLSFALAVPFRSPWRKPRPSVPYEGSVPGILQYLLYPFAPTTPYNPNPLYLPTTSATPFKPSKPNSPKPTGPLGENSRRDTKDIHGTAVKRAPPPPGRTPLRNAGDIYSVAVEGYDYQVFTPYYKLGKVPVGRYQFPTEAGKSDQIIITHAYNGKELPHNDGSPRLYLSEMIQDVAKYHAHKPLSSINKVVVESVINDRTLAAVRQCYAEWRAAQTNKNVRHHPTKVTVNPSNRAWADFKYTPFVTAANFAFKDSGKTVESVDVISDPDIDLVLHMGPR
ncbi:hypothetical protein LY76DRAFT_587102 [Colletotrichum caudatum]|nr:hypothetical protein LY76DRAFT_587102 [Colletotrichum caudatum]